MRRTRFYCHAARPSGLAALLLALLLWGNGPAAAQSVGWAPRAVMVQGEYGDFYGTTSQSVNGEGTVFKMTPSGTLSTLHNFNGTDGATPNAVIQVSGGSFYGTTQTGGANGYGTLFGANGYGTLFGANGYGTLFGANGYGTLFGADGWGTVFEMKPTGKLTTLYSFTGGNDGGYPEALTRGQDGNFYGTTLYGGSGTAPNTPRPGTIFQITPAGAFTTLYSFTGGSDGATPYTLAQGKDGNFYGMTNSGGANGWGTIFKITPSGAFTTLYTFTGGSDGAYPSPLTLGKDGNFYGTTQGPGTVFQITPSGVLTTLYSFFENVYGADNPRAGLTLDREGNFYGTYSDDAIRNYAGGGIFQITPAGVLTYFWSF